MSKIHFLALMSIAPVILTGCVVPAETYYQDPAYYDGINQPVVVEEPVVYQQPYYYAPAPTIGIGFGFYGGGHHWHGGRH